MGKKTIAGQIKDCANAVLVNISEKKHNWKYNAAYFGKAMRSHMEAITKDGIELPLRTKRLVLRADACLWKYFDGKDCSFVS